ncbi:MAG TPA: glycosyltransferase family 2 protein [Xanthobacteraceae bacterium]|nr:glycosyltransferase family 2 protein [Xanthobacteraceae bacterium]
MRPASVSAPLPYGPASAALPRPEISVIIPIYNEEDNVEPLFAALLPVLRGLGRDFEVIAVNDGSRDATLARLRAAAARIPELRVVDFRRNYGQTAAMMAGIDHAAGDVIVSLDADLQNDPHDIPLLLAKLDEGYDVVSGWRKDRQDYAIRRVLVSKIANAVISRISGVPLKDYGCTLKAYRSDVLKGVRLYGEMHRFIPIYASWMGARTTEMAVRHHPRRFGQSKYGLARIVKVILDLIVVKFLDRYFVKPIYVFGGFGLFAFLLSGLSGAAALYLKLFEGISLIQTPLPLLAAMTFLVGFMSILMGLLAEMLVRTYFESQNRAAYSVRELINFPRPE